MLLAILLHAQNLGNSIPQPFSRSSILSTQSFSKNNVHRFKLFDSSAKKDLPKVFIQAGLHGDESETVSFAVWLIERMKKSQGPLAALNSKVVVDIMPVANPDGYKILSRNNPKDINLNRNFSVFHGRSIDRKIGKTSFSEKETASIKTLFQKQKYNLAIDIHGFVPWLVLPTTPEAVKANAKKFYTAKKAKRYKKFADIARSLKNEKLASTYKVVTPFELGDGGSFEDWAFWEQNALSLCFEMESQLAAQDVSNWERYEAYLAELISKSIQQNLI